MESELKPCPKCNGQLTTIKQIAALDGKYVRVCELCNHWGPVQDTEQIADEAWNCLPTPLAARRVSEANAVKNEAMLMDIIDNLTERLRVAEEALREITELPSLPTCYDERTWANQDRRTGELAKALARAALERKD